MELPSESYFSVTPANRTAAIAHVTDRGFPPLRIEQSEDGLVVLVFAPVPDERMFDLAQALPIHLSAKIGYVVGGEPPFRPERPSVR
jgi:hypothetical protein